MIEKVDNISIDDHVDREIYDCLNPASLKSFFLFAGAGSGKTRSLVTALGDFKREYGKSFRLRKQKVAIITYTNAASDEIKHRLEYEPIFEVSTIHSFAWELIKPFSVDIKSWLRVDLEKELLRLEDEQNRSKNLENKTSIDRANKIKSKKKRIESLDSIYKFSYNPNGNNGSKGSLNHTEVIKIASDFIGSKRLLQTLLVNKYPVVLIDESQDTKKELISAFFELQQLKKDCFSLGLFGDTMQRIYSDGKEDLGKNLPTDWRTPEKKLNHRSNKRIVTLINDIRSDVDGQVQIPRTDKPEGIVRLFICNRGVDKSQIESTVVERMSIEANDSLWNLVNGNVKTLILEHHMAARRMGFLEFFEPLYKEDKLSTALLDGSLSEVNFFTKIILPLVDENAINDQFLAARILRKYPTFLTKDSILKNGDQIDSLRRAKSALDSLVSLWEPTGDPLLIDILRNVYSTGLFPIPEGLLPIVLRTPQEQEMVKLSSELPEGDLGDSVINAWDAALSNPFSQIRNYFKYLSEDSKFGTHQGVKGLQYPRVMVILDDEESKGFMFSYDKLFGSKELSQSDLKNISAGNETGIDRTKRLFYVACSRAEESLAVLAYTNSPSVVRGNAINYGWFKESEIEIV